MLKQGFRVKCNKCEKTFTSYRARANHIKWIHNTPPKQCTVCSKRFRDSYALRRHVKSCHENNGGESSKLCPVCHCKFRKKCAPEHFQQHGLCLESETLEFIDSATFEQWKTKMEKETNSKFVKQRAQRTVQQDIKVNEYCCHRSGNFKSKSRGVRTLNVRGSKKIDAYCPAAIVTHSLSSGEVIVNFQKTHVGHEKEVDRPSLTKEERAEFASQIPVEVQLEDILVEVATNVSDLEERKATVLAKFSEMVKSVKTDAGLEALEAHIAPLQFIINYAEEKVSANFVSGTKYEPPNKKFCSTEKANVSKKQRLNNTSLSEYDSVTFCIIKGMSQDHTV